MLSQRSVFFLAFFFFLGSFSSVMRAQSTTVSCTKGETGTCRQAKSCSQSDVQAAVNASSAGGKGYISPTSFDGDGIYVPGGTCSWSSSVSWSNKNINVIGANPTITNSGYAFTVTATNDGATAAAFHISGFNFTGSTSGGVLNINDSNPNQTTWNGYFRVDHITYNYSSSGNVFIIYGPVWGLFDHITGSTPYNHFEQADFLNSEYSNTHGGSNSQLMGEYSGRILPISLGTKDAIYVEDSTFTCLGNYSGALSDSESGGQRMVWRHNSSTGTCYHYAHWTRGTEYDGHKYEIYNNTYNGNGASDYSMRFGSGTGVIFNNTITGYGDPTIHVDETRGAGGEVSNGPYFDCNGTRALDGNAGDASAPGWPCAGQIGMACIGGSCTRSTMNSVPLLVWNNGSQSGCANGGSCTNSVTVKVDGPMGSYNSATRSMANYIKSTAHSAAGSPWNGAVDYCQGSTMPSACGTYTNKYVPYTYPHPLAASTTAVPSSPTNLKGTVN